MIYISGSISNDPNYKQKFSDAKLNLCLQGYLVDQIYSPPEFVSKYFKEPESQSWHNLMIACLMELEKCKKIYMLKDWDESTGATIEHMWAVKLGLEVIYEN